jgi:tetratricopeptide (TPR) repeat protein
MMCVTALALHLAAYVYCASQAFGGDPWRPDPALMAISAASGLVPAVLCGYLLFQAVSGAISGSQVKSAPFEHRNKAETYLAKADTDNAVHQYRQQFEVNPASPRPLFAATAAMERDRRYFEAVDILREVVQRFRHDDAVWSDATYRLALLLENHLGDHASARTLYRQIVERSPQSKAGHLAGARLGQYLSPPPEQ